MGKVARRKSNKTQRHALEEILSDNYNDSGASTGSSNNHSTSSTGSSDINSSAPTGSFDINSSVPTGSSDINSDAPTRSSDINPTVDNTNVTDEDSVKNTDYSQSSNVWKYATKLGPEKASCNLCNVGKYFQNTTPYYFQGEFHKKPSESYFQFRESVFGILNRSFGQDCSTFRVIWLA